jgi:amino acid adenylation domain-containing protein
MTSRLQSNSTEMLAQNEMLAMRDLPLHSDWTDTDSAYPHACVHELFELSVARDPDAVAVVCNERQLTYRDLNQRANQVANYLRKRGVGPDILVGVCLERSLELVVALLGVWKAGGAYVPLDPAYPKDRLSFMVGNAGMKLLLTDEKCSGLIPSAGNNAICLDFDWPAIVQENTGNLAATALPSNLAYVMYTSGSTGRPKGAMIQHNSLVNYLCWAIKTHEVDGKDSIPVHSSIAFDSTVASLYPPLLTGGQIELLPADMGAQNLLAALRRVKNRSKVLVTPGHLELLNQQLSPDEMAVMTKVLVIGGEALHAEKLSKWRDFAPATRLFNEYGPTETTVGCCSYEVRAEDPRNGPVPIGSPIANAQLYVLDANLHPVPSGVTGELYIGGPGVGRGYLNEPELTRERFLVDPFSGRNGSRLYKTGDLVRYRKDGVLEFLGRADDQVKIRGYRIELGEIETAVASYPEVQACKVVAREDAGASKQLVAYLITRKNESVDTEGLKNFLKQRLPDHMVPAYYIFLDSFPLTQNGKIDRKALPAPSYKDAVSAPEFVPPRTETENKLAAIWMELLKLERIGIHDNFFDLGGDSLLALKVMLQIRAVFGVVLSMHTFLPNATIAGLTKAVEDREESQDTLTFTVAVQNKGKELPFFWIGQSGQGRSLSNQLGPNQPFFGIGFEPQIVDQLKAPYRLEEIARHLVRAIREKQSQGPYRLCGFCLGAVFAFEVARQLTMQGQEIGLLVLFQPLNPSQSARVRFATGLRRMIVRVRFRFGELRRLEIGELPHYAHNRWKGLKSLFMDMILRISGRSRFLERQFRSPDLEKILFFAASSYKPKPLGCPTVIFRSKDWPMLSAGDPYFGWRELLTGSSEAHEVPGDHLGIFQEPNVKILADKLRPFFQNARKSGTPT